jgi:signal transduction histidine kinase
MIQVLAQIAREALSNKSELLLSSYLSLIRRSRALTYAMVVDTNGRVIAHSNVVVVGQKPSDPVAEKALETRTLLRQIVGTSSDELVDLSLPIYLEGRRVGTARLGYSQASTRQLVDESLQAARDRILFAAVATLFIGLLGSLILSYFITRPIQELTEGARQIGTGDLRHRLQVRSRDELGELADEFNIMAEKLQELDQLKQDFVSNVTHELRSPLTSLRGYVEFLLRGDAGQLSEEQIDNLIVVKNNAARLAKFIDNLLDVSKIEALKVELHPEAVPLPRAAKEMEVMFRPEAQEKNVKLELRIPEDLPRLWADPDKLSEILMNLISNAFKFTPSGGQVTVSGTKDGDFVHVSVKDTGVGIPKESLNSVFNKFEQVKPTEGLVRKTKGTGLGLTIVKGFVEAHGGRVWIESETDKGTTVHFTLPVAKDESDLVYSESRTVER